MCSTHFSSVSRSRKLGDGLFLECCKEVASGYPEITFNSMIVDNTTMQACPCETISLCGVCVSMSLTFLLGYLIRKCERFQAKTLESHNRRRLVIETSFCIQKNVCVLASPACKHVLK